MILGAALALLSTATSLSAARAVEATRAKVPGTDVEIALELPNFKAETPDDPGHTLLFGSLGDGVIVSVLYEENFPFLAGSSCVARRSKEPKFKAFKAGDLDGCEFTITVKSPKRTASFDQKHYHAFPTSPDFLFDIHLSVIEMGRGDHAVTYEREDFQKLAQTFVVKGRVDASKGRFPPEANALRDEAVAGGGDAMAWCEKRCADHPDEWAAHFYLGAVAYEDDRPDDWLKGYGRAAELLGAMQDRTPKHALALATSCDRAANASFARKKYALAVPWLERLLEQTKSDAPEAVQKLRPSALFNLAGCYAKTNQPDKAMDNLRAALAATPGLKKDAAESELFAPLRTRKDFKELVGA
jgi:tetratricopeptide (TPR) repeat protein